MDLLTSSASSVTAAAAGKAVETWAARRPFGGVDNGRFAASMGTVGRGGRIRRSHRHCGALMGVVGEGAQGFWLGARGGGEKVSITLVTIGSLLVAPGGSGPPYPTERMAPHCVRGAPRQDGHGHVNATEGVVVVIIPVLSADAQLPPRVLAACQNGAVREEEVDRRVGRRHGGNGHALV